MSKVRALAFPVFQKEWLFSAYQVFGEEGGSRKQVHGWASRFVASLQTRVMSEWKNVQESKPGTFKNIVLRLANWVLAREDPTEAFFKAVPTTGKNNKLEILYPDSYQEVFVRRHLLFTARNREKYHKAWFRATGVGIVPLLPLAVTPLPNLPIYYLAYRVYSHHKAWQGATAVLEHLQHLETYKPTAPDPDAGSQIHRSSSNLHATFDSSVTARVIFKADPTLTELSGSQHRTRTPLTDDRAKAIEEHFGARCLVQAVAKVRNRAEA